MPPGRLSPASWQYQPRVLPNDAPPVTPQPYFIATGATTGTSAVVTVTVQNPTGRGDAIVVAADNHTAATVPVSCTDTQNNTYSLVNVFNGQMHSGQFAAQNTSPLTTADTITVTFSASNSSVRQAIAIGVPATAVSAGGPFLTYDTFNSAGTGTGFVSVTAPHALAGIPQIAIAAAFTANAAGAPQFPQDWTVLRTQTQPGGDFLAVAYKPVANLASGATVIWTLQGASNATLMYLTLMPETRFAQAPPMPPGQMSPGAWQYLPAMRGGNTANTAVFPAAAATAGTISDRAAKALPAAVTTAGAAQGAAAKALPVAVTTGGAVARAAARTLTVTAATAAALARQASKSLAVTVTTADAVSRNIAKTLAAPVTTAGALARSAGRALTATVTAAAAVARAPAKALPAAVTTAGSLARGIQRAFRGAVTTLASLFQAARITLPPAVVTVTPAGPLAAAVTVTGQAPAAVAVTGPLAAVVTISRA